MDLHNEVSKIKEFNKEEGKSWGGMAGEAAVFSVW